jgi:hypothetical protein
MLLPTPDGGLAGVKLLDFGIAKIRDEQPGAVPMQAVVDQKDHLATAAGAIMGTPAYMAPEQIKNSSSVDKRADIYALGIMLYEALAGERPFVADTTAELMGAHMYKKAEPPSKTAQRRGVGPRKIAWAKVDPVVLRAIAKEPEQRYKDCASLQTDLEAAWGQSFALVRGAGLSGIIPAPSLTGVKPVAGAARRSRWPFVVAAAVAAALALAGGGVYVATVQRGRVQPVTSAESERAAALFTAARDGDAAGRRALLEAIELVGGRAHLPTIAQALTDDDTAVWRAALSAAGQLAQPGDALLAEPLAALATQAVGASSVDVAAARLRIGEAEAQATLTSLMQSPIPTPEARLRAAVALARAAHLPAAGLRQALEAALRAGSVAPALRRAALIRLVQLHDTEALKQVNDTAHPSGKGAPQEPQHSEALAILALAQQPHAAAELRRAAESARGEPRLDLAVTLSEAGDPHAASLLQPLLKSADVKTRRRALAALCHLGKAGHYPAYTKTAKPFLADADAQTALIAAVALLEQSPPPAKAAEPPRESARPPNPTPPLMQRSHSALPRRTEAAAAAGGGWMGARPPLPCAALLGRPEGGDHRLRGQAVLLQQVGSRASLAERVLDAHAGEADRHPGLQQRLGHRAAEASEDGVVLGGDDDAGAARRGDHQLVIQGLGGRQVDHRHLAALLRQQRRRVQAGADHEPAGKQHAGVALPQHLAASDLKTDPLLGAGLGAADAQIHRAMVRRGGVYRGGDLLGAARLDEGHVRQRPQDRQILDRLVRDPEQRRKPRQEADQLDVDARVGQLHRDLIERATAAEHAEGMEKGNVPTARHAGRYTDGVGLGDTEVVEALGEGVPEQVDLGRAGQVRAQAHHLGALAAEGAQGLAIDARIGAGAVPAGADEVGVVGGAHDSAPSSRSAAAA